jgi:Ca2+-binding EF-hand superfamily protein
LLLPKETIMRALSPLLPLAISVAAFAGVARAADQQTPYDVKAAFAQTDTNKDGEIDLCEFHERLVEVFYNADTNKDGYLSPEEYARLPFSGDFKDADLSGKGRISLHDFIAVRYRQFVEADTNHDGALSLEEVVAAYEGRK